ncbi:hypothetical protein MLD38_026403 [Melastoma candidum]|uniref:Uncharacterized protein n=1 Tax=Melastoma candidum TaxID=119954 RepID=A0ACB9NYH8_9MYRT|nr:hypothetical protein MLD38_026403 [Melastoma candidum]
MNARKWSGLGFHFTSGSTTEYCPEETNVVISKVTAKAYYRSLLEKRSDLGEVLLMMARDLETISYRESFHGAFSSANAAVNLIMQRIDEE